MQMKFISRKPYEAPWAELLQTESDSALAVSFDGDNSPEGVNIDENEFVW